MKQPAKATRKSATKARATNVKHKAASRSKAAAPKGIHHRVKRAYHATPKFVHGMVVGGVVGLLVVGFLGAFSVHPDSTSADILGSTCAVKRVGTNDAGTANSRFTLNSDGTVSAKFQVSGFNCHEVVTLVTWNAPNATDGIPYSSQTLFAKATGTYGVGEHTITTKLPNCFYQADLVTGSDVSMYPTTSFSSQGRLRGNLHGGTQPCTTTITPPPSTTPVVETAATSLPNTGPGAVLIVLGLAILGGYIFHMTHRHRQHKKVTHHSAAHRKPAHHRAH
jgi:hypothetical protein